MATELPMPPRGPMPYNISMRALLFLLLLLFVFGCRQESPTADKAPVTKEREAPAAHDERFVGHWNQRFDLREDPDRDEAEMKLHLRMTKAKMATFTFEKDGTFVSESLGFANKGTWKSDGDTATLTVTSGPAFDMGGKSYDFQLSLKEDGSMQGEENGYKWYLTRIEE